jgi:hypothetical protein
MTTAVQEQLSVQERALAYAMLHRIGDATIRFAMDGSGERRHTLSFTGNDYDNLKNVFAANPTTALAWARRSLVAISTDTRLSEADRSSRLDRYLDAYTDLTLRLEHNAFPASPTVRRGLPHYIPDGYVDLGKYESLQAARGSREQIWVDKRTIFEKYKPTLKKIFSHDYSGMSLSDSKLHMASTLALAVYTELPYSQAARAGDDYIGDQRVRLSELTEGVCRHQALVFQVLGQAVGLAMRVAKGELSYTDNRGIRHTSRHTTNLLQINGQWSLYDATNPDFFQKPNGVREWRPGRHAIDGPPPPDGQKDFTTRGRHGGQVLTYSLQGSAKAHWFIEHPRS